MLAVAPTRVADSASSAAATSWMGLNMQSLLWQRSIGRIRSGWKCPRSPVRRVNQHNLTVTFITVETRPGSLGGGDGQRYACATRMQWIERFGGYLALALLAFMWPVLDAYQKGLLPS